MSEGPFDPVTAADGAAPLTPAVSAPADDAARASGRRWRRSLAIVLLAGAALAAFAALGARTSTDGGGPAAGAQEAARAGNPWLTPFSATRGDIQLREDSDELAAELGRLRQFGLGVEQEKWSAPVYTVRSTDDYPRVRVYLQDVDHRRLSPFDWTRGQPHEDVLAWLMYDGVNGEGWPIPPWAQPDPSGGADGHMVVYVEDTGQYLEMNDPTRLPNGDWVASWGGYIENLEDNPGYWPTREVTDRRFSFRGWGSSTHGPVIRGLIRETEIRDAYAAWERGDMEQAVIPHAIGLLVHAHSGNTWVWPAQRTDFTLEYGKGGDPIEKGPIEMGQIFRLPEDVDVRSLRARTERETALLQIVARTYQRYGAIVWDATGGGLKMRAEQVWTPQGMSQDMFDYGDSGAWMAKLPFERLEAIETRPDVPGRYRPPPGR